MLILLQCYIFKISQIFDILNMMKYASPLHDSEYQSQGLINMDKN